jgi:hypothetical protein
VIKKFAVAVAMGVALAGISTGAPVYATGSDNGGDKCKAYYYEGWNNSTNICGKTPDDGKKKNCSHVGYKVRLKNHDYDPWGLDGSGKNIGKKGHGCESKPPCPKPTASPSPSKSTSSPSTSPSSSSSPSPSNTVTTTVPPTSTSPSPSRTATASATATSEPEESETADNSEALPVTGPSAPILFGVGLVLMTVGAVALVMYRRRRISFQS